MKHLEKGRFRVDLMSFIWDTFGDINHSFLKKNIDSDWGRVPFFFCNKNVNLIRFGNNFLEKNMKYFVWERTGF